MAVDERSEDDFPREIDIVYETRASLEEECLEKNEEEVREIIEAGESEPLHGAMCIIETRVEVVFRAEEELLTGDADDPSLREKSA